MKKRLWFFVMGTGAVFLSALLAGCGQDKSAPELVVNTDALGTAANLPPTPEPEVTTSAQAVAMVAFTDQACLTCHTNQDVLKALAVEEEDAGESLSSGPG